MTCVSRPVAVFAVPVVTSPPSSLKSGCGVAPARLAMPGVKETSTSKAWSGTPTLAWTVKRAK
jgi:hypothetical protein